MSNEVNMTDPVVCMCSVKISVMKFGECPLGLSDFSMFPITCRIVFVYDFPCVWEIINTTDSHVHGKLNWSYMIYTRCPFFAFEMNLKWIEHVRVHISKCVFSAKHLKIFGCFLENILASVKQN